MYHKRMILLCVFTQITTVETVNTPCNALIPTRNIEWRGLLNLKSLYERFVLDTTSITLKTQDSLLQFVTEHELHGEKGVSISSCAKRRPCALIPSRENSGVRPLYHEEYNTVSVTVRNAKLECSVENT